MSKKKCVIEVTEPDETSHGMYRLTDKRDGQTIALTPDNLIGELIAMLLEDEFNKEATDE